MLAVSWVRLAADLRRSSLAVLSAREEERRRIRRDLHDGLGPQLTGISLGLHTAIRQLNRAGVDGTPLRTARAPGRRDGHHRRGGQAHRARPSADRADQLGLVGAVAEFAHGFDDALQLHLELPRPDLALPAAVEVAVYRIVTEALTNVVRHAEAARCWLRIEARDVVEIEVVDDGVGLPPGPPVGVGLAAMRERAAELGGTVTVGPRSPHGTACTSSSRRRCRSEHDERHGPSGAAGAHRGRPPDVPHGAVGRSGGHGRHRAGR